MVLLKHKEWIINSQDESLVQHISNKFNISTTTASLIINRGYIKDEEIDSYLNISEKNFYDPFLLKGMYEAVNHIKDSVLRNDKIAIYGDYDVDGITSTYILYDYLKSINADVIFYIPDRMDEGYGLNISAIDKLKAENVRLIITVDVGITAINEVNYASYLGINVIITDHHTPQETLPNAISVINPKISDSKYPNKNLAGVGVAYKLAYALSNCDKNIMRKYSQAACIGTIADMVPLTDENRFIASYGLECIKSTENLGLNALIDISSLNKKEINSSSISFSIAPRLNAAGRIASATSSVELFVTNSEDIAKNIAQYLDNGNKNRQIKEQLIMEKAIQTIENEKLYEDKIIVVSGKNWHHGIIGIVSSKITEKYYKPSCVISTADNIDIAKASGRSIPGFSLFDALTHVSDTLTKYGGHELAAGFSLKTDNINIFREKINRYADENITDDILKPKLSIDAVISIENLTNSLAHELQLLEPYGTGNKAPVLMIKNSLINNLKLSKNSKHVFLTLTDNQNYIDSPGFNMPELSEDFHPGDMVDIAGTVNINKFRGTENTQLFIKDIKTSENSKYTIENLRCVFKCIKYLIDNNIPSLKLYELSSIIRKNYRLYLSNKKLINIINIFNEVQITSCTFQADTLNINKGFLYDKKCLIENSQLYQNLLERMY